MTPRLLPVVIINIKFTADKRVSTLSPYNILLYKDQWNAMFKFIALILYCHNLDNH